MTRFPSREPTTDDAWAHLAAAPAQPSGSRLLRTAGRTRTSSSRGCLSWTEAYLPSSPQGAPMGGDLFDVIALDPRRVLLVMGDVSGHGSAVTGRRRQLRAALRRVATAGAEPAAIVTALDLAVARSGEPDELATLWVGALDNGTGVLRTANAGHPPPVIAWGTSASLFGAATAPPLGTGVVGQHVRTGLVHVPRGAFLVAYSDGLVERRGTDIEDQLVALRDRVEEHALSAPAHGGTSALLDRLLDDLQPLGDHAADDVSVVVVRRERKPAAG